MQDDFIDDCLPKEQEPHDSADEEDLMDEEWSNEDRGVTKDGEMVMMCIDNLDEDDEDEAKLNDDDDADSV